MAAANGHAALVSALLAAGAAPAVANESGNTPLHYACLNAHPECARLLLAAGASPGAANAAERTPADEALGLGARGEATMAEIRKAFPTAEGGEGEEGKVEEEAMEAG